MGENRRQLFRCLGFASSLGIALVLSIVIGVGAGYYIDKWLDCSPWGVMICMFCGIIAGFENIYVISRRALEQMEQADKSDDPSNGQSKP